MKSFLRSVIPSLLAVVITPQFLPAQQNTFYVNGSTIYAPNGEAVIFRGVNKMIFYNDRDGDPSYREIARTGANAVRIFWFTSGTAAELDQTLANAIAQNMIPIPAVWEATGKWGADLQQCVNYWSRPDIVAVIEKYKRYVIVNIANEAGNGSQSQTDFRNTYAAAVTQIRNAGVTVPLMIDAAGWGRNEEYIFNNAAALQSGDPLHKLIFSWHPWDANAPNSRIQSAFDRALAQNIPFIVGEFAHKSVGCACCIPYLYLINYAQQRGIGWLAWEWGPGNSDCSEMDMTTDNTFPTLRDWGLQVAVTDANSIQNTSVRPNIFGTGGDTQPPSVPGGLSAASVTQTSLTLNWNASSDNTQVTGYEVFRNGSSIGTTNTTSFNITGLTAGTTYTFTVRARDAVPNWSAQSSGLSVTTTGGGGGGTTTLGPVADTDTQSDVPAGTNTTLNASLYNYLFMKFNLASISGTITSARLRVYTNPGAGTTLNVYNTSTDNWTEGSTKPALAGLMTSAALTTGAGYKEVDVTSQVATQAAGDDVISFGLTTNLGSWTGFNSRENGSNKPQLVIITSGGGGGDTQAPTVPGNLAASSITQTTLTLTWSASTDNVAVTGYEVFRNGASIGTSTTTSINVTGLSAGTTYSFTVRARDAVPNWSAQSASLNTTTTGGGSGGTTTVNPVADTDTQSDVPAGTNPTLNASQYNHIFMKFNLAGITGTITSARLRLYTNPAGGSTLNVSNASTDNWNEGGAKPTLGSLIASVSMTAGAGYKEVDVTSQVVTQANSDDLITFGITTNLGTWTGFNSRENASNKPQLVVTTAAGRGIVFNAETATVSSKSFSVYPNPASSFIMVEFQSATNGTANIQIVNNVGQTVNNVTRALTNGNNRFQLFTSLLPAGQYYLRVREGNDVHSHPFSIKRP